MRLSACVLALLLAGCGPVDGGPEYYARLWRRHRDMASIYTVQMISIREGTPQAEVLRLLGKPDREFRPSTFCKGADYEAEYHIKVPRGQYPWSYSVHCKDGKVVEFGEWTLMVGPLQVKQVD